MSRTAKLVLPFAAATVASLAVASPALAADRDHDGMRDSWEKHYHVTNPRLDADHDGLSNLAEYRAHTNPRKADPAAVASVAGDLVTFTLADGRTIDATVTDAARIECRAEDAPVAVAARHGGRDGQQNVDNVDNSGPGNAQDRPQPQPADAPVAAAPADQPQVDNSGPGNADDRCTPDELDGATVRKAEMRLGPDGLVLTRLELVAIRQSAA